MVRMKSGQTRTLYLDGLTVEAAHHGNTRAVYANTELSGIFNKPERPIKDKMGHRLPEKKDKERWVEYFEELPDRPTLKDPVDIHPANYDLSIVCTVPSKEEIRKAIVQLKNGKSAGPDGIQAEALKVDIDTFVAMLYLLFMKIWE